MIARWSLGGVVFAALLPVYVQGQTGSFSYIVDSGNNRIRLVDRNGNIATVAGNGISGYSGDGGAATESELASPFGIAVDGSGNVYIADESNSRIRKVTVSTGNITTIAGNGTAGYSGDGGPATGAALNYPQSIGLDSSGNIYIADTSNSDFVESSTAPGHGDACFSPPVCLWRRTRLHKTRKHGWGVAVISVSDFTASPNAIPPKHGPFVLTLMNRARTGPMDLVLDSPNVPPVQLAAVGESMHLDSFRNVRRLDSVIDPPPGIYQFKRKATGQVLFTITIE